MRLVCGLLALTLGAEQPKLSRCVKRLESGVIVPRRRERGRRTLEGPLVRLFVGRRDVCRNATAQLRETPSFSLLGLKFAVFCRRPRSRPTFRAVLTAASASASKPSTCVSRALPRSFCRASNATKPGTLADVRAALTAAASLGSKPSTCVSGVLPRSFFAGVERDEAGNARRRSAPP